MSLVDVLLTAAATPVAFASSYLAALAVLARREPERSGGTEPKLQFDIIVPAHDEETEITETVRALLAMSYPKDKFRVFVVADNCTDRTAERATAAGARVLVRQNDQERGKGYALAYAFERSLADRFADAIVVVDADTIVSANLLSAFARRFADGAAVVQADYGVRNPRSSWRTRVMTIALASFHGVRSVARERLGLSCGLRGNGMGFSRAVLEAHPPKAFSIVEDLEYGIQLGYAGIRVQYVDEATVVGHMAVSENAARTQRRRWERGRQALVREHVGPLLAAAWRRKDPCLLDLALDLLVPPIGQIVMLAAAGLAVSLAAARFGVTVAPWVWGASLVAIAAHVARGWSFSGMGWRGLLDLLWAPVYIIWKLSLRFGDKGKAPQEWVRTKREAHS
jgi:1,2-diacylglycerol 3-beta-glucosyltransferase